MTSSPSSVIAAARALHTALEAGLHGDALRPLFTDDAKFIERPNSVRPTGGVRDLAGMVQDSLAGSRLLSQQRYEVHSEIAHGNTAILRVTWTGVIARDVGPFHAGQVLTAHVAQFVETRDGRIAAIESFDCYEPFAR